MEKGAQILLRLFLSRMKNYRRWKKDRAMRKTATIHTILFSILTMIIMDAALHAQPAPTLSMALSFAGRDSVVIILRMNNNNVTWGCQGVMAAVTYNPTLLIPSYTSLPIHMMRFSQNSWLDFSQPGLEGDGFDPDMMGYGEGVFGNTSVNISGNAQVNLCKMNWHPKPPNFNGVASFSYVGNIPQSGNTGYLWTGDPDQRAFASVSGLSNVSFPVELSSFHARREGNVVVLRWTTESERNNRGFEIQRRGASDGKMFSTWETIDFVRGKNTTSERTEYMTMDQSSHTNGVYQYRLKQIDNDGTFNFSHTVEVVFDVSSREFSLSQNYPNPVGRSANNGNITTITFSIPDGSENIPVRMTLYDMLGREVLQLAEGVYSTGTRVLEFDASVLPQGLYLYQLRSGATSISKMMTVID